MNEQNGTSKLVAREYGSEHGYTRILVEIVKWLMAHV